MGLLYRRWVVWQGMARFGGIQQLVIQRRDEAAEGEASERVCVGREHETPKQPPRLSDQNLPPSITFFDAINPAQACKSTAMVYRSIQLHLLLIYCCIPIVTSFHYKDSSSSTLSSDPLTLSNTSISKSNATINISNKMSDIFSDIDVSGFPDDALPDHQKYEHPLVQR
eukprot:scaffold31207_cov83-Skeletonema_dohrnii-CCMP3373.AAC.1